MKSRGTVKWINHRVPVVAVKGGISRKIVETPEPRQEWEKRKCQLHSH